MSNNSQGFDFSDVSARDLLDPNTDLGPEGNDDQQGDQDEPTGDDNADDQNDSQDDTGSDDGDDSNNDDPNQDDDSPEGDDDGEEDGDEGSDDGEEGGDPELTVIEELQNLTGIELEEGEEFPDDIEGIAKYTKKVGEKFGQQYVANLFEAFPDVEKYLNFRAQGGDANKYFELQQATNTYENVNEESLKGNPALQKQVVSEMFSKMGYTEDDIKDTIKDLEDSELLLKQAVKSGGRLKAIAQEEQQKQIELQEQQAAERKQQEVETWKQIGEKISEGNLKGFTVPETDKKSFYEWMSKPVDQKGTTQRQRDMEKMDVESTLALEYLYYKQFDLGNLAKNFKTSAKNNSLRNRLSKKNKGASPAQRLSGGSRGGNSRAASIPSLKDVL